MSTNDNLFQSLESYGGETINERVYHYLGNLGYTGAINDRLSKYEHEDKKGWQGLIKGFGLEGAPGLLRHNLFGGGQQGVMYVPQPTYLGQQVLFQDSAGTTPVTADGQTVGLMLDLSKGLVRGPQLVTNGTFDTDTDWDLNSTAISITGGSLVFDGSQTADVTASNLAPSVAEGVYEITYDVNEGAVGNTRIIVNDFVGAYTSSKGRVHYIVKVGTSQDRILVQGNSSFAGSIDNVSIRELPGNHATQTTAAAKPLYRTNGVLHWLEGDGIDDLLIAPLPSITFSAFSLFSATGIDVVQGGDIVAAASTESGGALDRRFGLNLYGASGAANFGAISTRVGTGSLVARSFDAVTANNKVFSGHWSGGIIRTFENVQEVAYSAQDSIPSTGGVTEFLRILGHITYEGWMPQRNYGLVLLDEDVESDARTKLHNHLANLAGVTL